jgi:hypothetical protein
LEREGAQHSEAAKHEDRDGARVLCHFAIFALRVFDHLRVFACPAG